VVKGKTNLLITHIWDLIDVNPNGENFVATNINCVKIFFFEKCKYKKINHPMLFFLRDAMTTCKTKVLIQFTLFMIIEWIKKNLVDMGIFYGIIIKKSNFEVFWSFPKIKIKHLGWHTFFFWWSSEKNYIPAKLVYSYIFKKSF
jgi:hypothetical protein